MSATPIMPALNLAPAPLRDTQPMAAPPAAHTIAAVARTITKTAIQQPQSGSETDLIARMNRAIRQDTRAQLAGPPPSFQVSLLQQMREMQADPIPQGEQDNSDPPPAAISDLTETGISPKEHAPYLALQGMSAEADMTQQRVALSI